MQGKPKPHQVLIGPAGWSYPDWEGIVYPAHKPRGFHEATYLAQFFDTIEINTTFYYPPQARVTRTWVDRVASNPNFKFTAKLWQRFTHERAAGLDDEKTFKEGLRPLLESGRLGALLLQFPWSFRYTQESHEYIGALSMQFLEYPLVLEVRHSSWNRPGVFEWLGELGVGFCNIDQPVIGRSISPTAQTIPQSGIGYVRLHGRNYEHWFSSEDHPEERYNYLYSLQELEPWAERINNIAEHSRITFVITNNHFEGKAIANAFQLIRLVRNQPVRVPETMKARYPELAAIALPEDKPHEPHQADLLFEAPVPHRKIV